MVIRYLKNAIVLLLLLCGCMSVGLNKANADLTDGNILVSQLNTGNLGEFTTAGGFVQSFNIPDVNSGFNDLRDIIVGQSGNVYAYSGTFDPTLATLDPTTAGITRDTLAGWSTINNVSYGGIATFGRYVYTTDMATAGTGAPQGIVRFDTLGGTTIRFGSNGYIDLTVGADGLLYALRGGTAVDVYDPATNTLINTVNLTGTSDVRGIAVDSDGMIYAASWNELVSSHTSTGSLVDSILFTDSALFDNDLTDIDINDAGDILVSSRFGGVLLGDTSLTSFTSFTYGSGPVHATFVTPLTTVPEPSSLLVIAGFAGLFLSRRRR